MDEAIKRAVAQEIKRGFFEHVIDVETAEAWAKHYFWPWYFSAKSAGRDCSLNAFFSEIPKSNLKTADQNAEIVLPNHAALLEQIDEILKSNNSMPTPATSTLASPAPASEVEFVNLINSRTPPNNQPPKKSKKR